MTIPAVIPLMKISGSFVTIAVICGRKGQVEAGASAIPGVTVTVCRIGVGWRIPRVGPAVWVAPIRGGSGSPGLGRCGSGNSQYQRTCDRQQNRYASHDTVLLCGAVWRSNSDYCSLLLRTSAFISSGPSNRRQGRLCSTRRSSGSNAPLSQWLLFGLGNLVVRVHRCSFLNHFIHRQLLLAQVGVEGDVLRIIAVRA